MINNPYELDGSWLKGNLHTHTEGSPCGHYSIDKVIEMYTSYKMEYDFLAITDHYIYTDINEYIDDKKIIIFGGVEYKEKDLQTLGINIKECVDDKNCLSNHQQLFNSVLEQGAINIICHPHVYRDDYWPLELLLQLDGYTGIEIFNNNVKHDNKGRALATDLWDKLLTRGKKVYGFANDDMHVFPRAGGAFNMVLAEETTRESILHSIKNGSFYASTGVIFDFIKLEEDTIKIRINKLNAKIRFIGNGGILLKEKYGLEASYKINGKEKYIRVEISREDGGKAWTQPFFLE